MGHQKKRFRRRAKICRFTVDKIHYIDYKNIELLREFTPTNGKILPRRVTGTRPIYQHKLDPRDQARPFHGPAAVRGSVVGRSALTPRGESP